MAQYNADILLAVRGSEKAKREIEKLEASLDKLGKKASLDLSGQIRLKGAQSVLKERLKDQVAWNKEQKKSQQIARETSQELARQAQRAKGLNQFSNGGVFPKPDLEKEITKRNRIRAITRATAKIEASKTARLQGQNSLTNGLLKLNKATLEAARSEAQERADAVSSQKFLNTQLQKTQQLTKTIRKEQVKTQANTPKKGGGGGAGGDLAAGIGFPLLFGSGPGSVIGGALGSAGGFGTQILASAIGGIIDAFVSDLANLGGALTEVAGFANVATEKLLLSSKAREKELKTLQKLGFNDLADSLAKVDFENKFGTDAVNNLENLSKEFDTFGRTVAALTTSLGAFIAGPLAELLRSINEGSSKDQAVNLFNRAKIAEGSRRIKEQGATTEAQQIKIRQKVEKEYITKLQEIVKAKQKELNVTQLTLEQKAIAYIQAQKELARTPKQLEGEAGARTALAGLSIEQTLQARAKQTLDIADKYGNIQKRQQEQQDNYDRQRVDIVRSYEQSIAQTREKVEQRILSLRIQGIQKANEIENQRAANQLAELQRSNSAASQQQQEGSVFAGTRPELAATAQTIDDAFRSIAEAELSAEQQKAQIKRDAAFEVLKLELDGEKFKVNVAKEVSKLNLDTARRIERINIGIAKKNQDFSENKFNIEKAIANTQLEVIKQENALLLVQLVTTTDFIPNNFGFQNYIKELITNLDKAQNVLAQAKPPGKLSSLAPVGGEGVPTAGAETALNNLIERQRVLTAERLKSIDILKATNKEAELAKISGIRIADQQTINTLLLQQVDAITAQQRILELQTEGRSKEQAVAIQQIETTFKLIDANLGVTESKLKTELAALQAVEADKEDLEIIEKIKQELQDVANLKAGLPLKKQEALENAANQNPGKIKAFVDQMQIDLADTQGMVVSLAQSVESSLATAMSSAVQTLITGTGSVKEAFSDMFAGIGKAFIDMATQMLAQQAIFFLLKALGGGFGGGGGGGGDIFAKIASRGGLGMAEGGYVTGPTNALIGEGGEPEYVIPESKMRESMGRYSRGSRGSSVIPAEGGGSAGAEGGVAVAAPIDVRFKVERINSVDYVTATEFQQGMQRAAKEGAQRGEQQTIKRLQMSSGTRKRLGL